MLDGWEFTLNFRVSARAVQFLHHDFVVGQHHGSKMDKLLARQPGDEIGKRGIQGSNTIRETELVIEEASYRFAGRGPVGLHSL